MGRDIPERAFCFRFGLGLSKPYIVQKMRVEPCQIAALTRQGGPSCHDVDQGCGPGVGDREPRCAFICHPSLH